MTLEKKTTHFCLECSAELPKSSDYCGICGTPLHKKTMALTPIRGIVDPLDTKKGQVEMHQHSLEAQEYKGEDQEYKGRMTVKENAVLDLGNTSNLNSGNILVGKSNWEDTLSMGFESDFYLSEFDEVERQSPPKIAIALIAVSVLSVFFMSVVLYLQVDKKSHVEKEKIGENISKVMSVSEDLKTNLEKEKVLRKVEIATSKKTKKGYGIYIGTTSLFSVRQIKGSRYKTLEGRARSIIIRLNHTLEKIRKEERKGYFVAIRNGAHSEISYRQRNGDLFRITDFSKRDIAKKKRKKLNPHMHANFIADALNTSLGLEATIKIARR